MHSCPQEIPLQLGVIQAADPSDKYYIVTNTETAAEQFGSAVSLSQIETNNLSTP